MRLFVCGRDVVARTIAEENPGAVLFADEDVNNTEAWPYMPDLIVSVGYLHILKPATLSKAPAINCHYSLLPRHRGRSSVPWAIFEGDTMTGITWHWIDAGIDTGRIILQAACQIDAKETQATLFAKLNALALDTWPAARVALALRESGFYGWEQRGATNYNKAGPPNGGVIDPNWSLPKVECFIRAMTYPPLAYATWEGQEVTTVREYLQLRFGSKYQYAQRDDNLPVSG